MGRPVGRSTAVAMFRRPCITKSEAVASRLIGVASPYGTGGHRLPAAAALMVFTSGTSRGTSRASSKGCGLEVEPARACYPHDPPASFTGTRGALRHADFDHSTVVSPQLKGIDAGRGSRLSGVLVDQQRAAVGRSGSLSA